MEKSLKSFLLLSSVLGLLPGCAAFKPGLQAPFSDDCKAVITKRINTATYETNVDFFKKHLSGMLVFKALNDTTERAVFVIQTGFKFFDFEFTPSTFSVRYCLAALNKKPIVSALRRDLELMLNGPGENPVASLEKNGLRTYIFAAGAGKYNYCTVNHVCSELVEIESGTKSRRPIGISIYNRQGEAFDSLYLAQRGMGLNISMKKLNR